MHRKIRKMLSSEDACDQGKANTLLVSSISEAIDIYIAVIQLVPALKGHRQERH